MLPIAVGLLTLWSGARAADLIVEENGVLPNYATIQAAVTAANSGDRIFVKNKAGNVPYQENVTITKSLSILSFDADGVYYTYGNYTLNPVANGEINIIGMYNQSGSVSAFAASTLTTPTRVNFVNNTLVSGSFNSNQLGWVAHVAGNVISGSITTRTATITGNLVTAGITVADVGGAVTGYPEDTLYVVGNRVTALAGGAGSGGITWSNDDDYFMINNNMVFITGTHNITLGTFKAGTGVNSVENNSVENNTAGSIYGMTFGTIPTGTTLKITNNSMYDNYTQESWTQYAFNFGTINTGTFVSLNYNVYRNWGSGLTNASGVTVSMTGNALGGVSFNSNDVSGQCTAPECVNLGSPSTDYTDLDLSRNDVGTAGGSYNFNNFWPNQTGGARVYLVKTPRTVVQSSTINAKADSYDR
ncbi:MAG: hypothetical protein U0176_11555 [Bacteroidia bacterium]